MHEFKHPKYYTELRKRNKLDQVISKEPATAGNQRAPGPGPKPQATSYKLPGPRPISNANKGLIHKQQATNDTTASGLKLQATGSRLQAPSSDKKE